MYTSALTASFFSRTGNENDEHNQIVPNMKNAVTSCPFSKWQKLYFFVRYISSFWLSSHLHQFSCTWHNISIGLIVHKARHPYRLPWYVSCLVDFSMHLDGPTLTTPAANCLLTFFCSRHLYEIMEYNNEYYYVILKDVLSYSLGKRCIVI